MTDEQLAIRAAGGDDHAFDLLARRLRGLAWSIADKFYAPGLERDDLVQAALVGLWKACRTYDRSKVNAGPSHDFDGFAALCMRRNLITAVKTARRMKHGPLDDALRLDGPPPMNDGDADAVFHEIVEGRTRDPLQLLLDREHLDAVIRAVRDDLTPLERDVAVGLSNGETYAEIGERLGFNGKQRCKAVDYALQRGRRKVLAALEEPRPLGAAA